MKRIAYFVSVLMLLFLVGCASKPQERVVIKTEIHTVKIPEALFEKGEVPVPPEKASFLAATVDEQKKMITKYIADLHKYIQDLRKGIDSIKESQDKQLESIERNKPQP